MVIFTSEQGSSFPLGGKWTCYDTGLKTAFIVRWPGKVKPGTRSGAMAQYVDVVPTLIEAAGGEPGKIDTGRPDAAGNRGFDGRSFLQVLLGRADRHRDYVYGAHTTRGIIRGSGCYPVRSVRSRRYKYLWNPNHTATFHNVVSTAEGGIYAAWKAYAEEHREVAGRVELYVRRPEEELYDLEQDPFELENRAGDPALRAVKADLRAELERWMRQQGDAGNATELKANERQGARGNRTWRPADPPPPKKPRKARKNRGKKAI